jgi:Trk K+ transport system NAD-binding subunit
LPLPQARWAITTFPQWESNRAFLSALKEAGFKGRVAGVVRDDLHAEALGAAGVERVLNPFNDAADYAARSFAAEIAFEDVHKDHAIAPPVPASPAKESEQ